MWSPSQARRFLFRSYAAKQIYEKNDKSEEHSHLGYSPILGPDKSFSSISYSISYLESNMISLGQKTMSSWYAIQLSNSHHKGHYISAITLMAITKDKSVFLIT